ncbi:unnamed protein product, partial [Phaeothamnion confervicola]
GAGQREVQEIVLEADADDVDGTFEIDFDGAGGFTADWDISAADLQGGLEALYSVGRVTVEREVIAYAAAPAARGFSWRITYDTRPGELPLLAVDGNATAVPLVGTGVRLSVYALANGFAPDASTTVDNLLPGEAYHARVRAFSNVGDGVSSANTAASVRGTNNAGEGVVPLTRAVTQLPPPPAIASVAAVSASQLFVALAPAEEAGAGRPALGYLVEWTSADDFGRNATKTVVVSNAAGVEHTQGDFRLWLAGIPTRRIPHDASAEDVAAAINAASRVGAVRVTRQVLFSDGSQS